MVGIEHKHGIVELTLAFEVFYKHVDAEVEIHYTGLIALVAKEHLFIALLLHEIILVYARSAAHERLREPVDQLVILLHALDEALFRETLLLLLAHLSR